jgi:hypothetical protein
MPGPNFILDKGFRTQAAVNAWTAVKTGTVNESVTPVTAVTDVVLGWSQETATAQDAIDGRVINVRMMGITRAIAGAAVGRGVRVKITATGTVIPATASGPAHGIAMFSVTTLGDHVDVLITPNGYMPA